MESHSIIRIKTRDIGCSVDQNDGMMVCHVDRSDMYTLDYATRRGITHGRLIDLRLRDTYHKTNTFARIIEKRYSLFFCFLNCQLYVIDVCDTCHNSSSGSALCCVYMPWRFYCTMLSGVGKNRKEIGSKRTIGSE